MLAVTKNIHAAGYIVLNYGHLKASPRPGCATGYAAGRIRQVQSVVEGLSSRPWTPSWASSRGAYLGKDLVV
jgi:hypothetical protein